MGSPSFWMSTNFTVAPQWMAAEADAVYAQIDSLQTSLNEATARYEAAQSSYEEAVALRTQENEQR